MVVPLRGRLSLPEWGISQGIHLPEETVAAFTLLAYRTGRDALCERLRSSSGWPPNVASGRRQRRGRLVERQVELSARGRAPVRGTHLPYGVRLIGEDATKAASVLSNQDRTRNVVPLSPFAACSLTGGVVVRAALGVKGLSWGAAVDVHSNRFSLTVGILPHSRWTAGIV